MPALCLRMLALPPPAAPAPPRAELQARLQAAAARPVPADAAAAAPALLGPPPADGCLDAGPALWVEERRPARARARAGQLRGPARTLWHSVHAPVDGPSPGVCQQHALAKETRGSPAARAVRSR